MLTVRSEFFLSYNGKQRSLSELRQSRGGSKISSVTELTAEVYHNTSEVSDKAPMHALFDRELCSACQKINFKDWNKLTTVDVYEFMRPIDRIVLKRNSCKLCKIVYESLCRKSDPLCTRYIEEHLEGYLKGKSFADWTYSDEMWKKNIKRPSGWPFGHTKDDISKDQDFDDAVNMLNVHAPQTTPYPEATNLVGDFSPRDHTIIEAVDNFVLSRLPSKHNLPCWVFMKLHTAASSQSGLLTIQIIARNAQPGSVLREVGTFNLRIASSSRDKSVTATSASLRYGNILTDKIDIRLSRLWLNDCLNTHSKCRQILSRYRLKDFRLVNIKRYCLEDIDYTQPLEYAALSYVRGGFEWSMLTTQRKSRYYAKDGLRPDKVSLPNSIQDAISVAQELDLDYVWVDALCILQDDESDQEAQMSSIGAIFQNASITIVISGDNANSAIEGLSTGRVVDQSLVSLRKSGVTILVPLQSTSDPDPWLSCAWTLQENFLSRRLLFFKNGCMSWQCRECACHEDMTGSDAGLPSGCDKQTALLLCEPGNAEFDNLEPAVSSLVRHRYSGEMSLTRSFAMDLYADLVADYSRRKMNNSANRLRPFSGLESLLSTGFVSIDDPNQDQWFFGLPLSLLDVALLWQPVDSMFARPPRNSCVPSWSWAGWEGAVTYEPVYTTRTDDKGALIQLITPLGHERIRPVVRFFITQDAKELPSNRSQSSGSFTRGTQSPQYAPPPLPIRPPSKRPPVPRPWRETLPKGKPPPIPKSSTNVSMKRDMNLEKARSRGVPASVCISPKKESRLKEVGLMSTWKNTCLPPTWEISHQTAEFRLPNELEFGSLDKDYYLIFQAEVASFKLGEEFSIVVSEKDLFERPDDRYDLNPNRTASKLHKLHRHALPNNSLWQQKRIIRYVKILDSEFQEVGRLQFDLAERDGDDWDFVALSETQFFGDEIDVDVAGFHLYNVMLISKPECENGARTRMGLGKVGKHAWRMAQPIVQNIVLG